MTANNLYALLVPLLLAKCGGAPVNRKEVQFPPYPAGVESVSGNLVQDTVGGTDYVIDWVHTPASPQLWFGRFIARDSLGHPSWRLVDTLTVPDYDSTRTLIIAQCTLNGHFDPELIALVVYQDAESLHVVLSAWRADRRSERFKPVPTTGIACANEGYGAD